MRRLVRERRAPSPAAVPDVAAALAGLRVEGAVLEGRVLVDLRRLLSAARELVTELRAIAEDAPRAAARIRPLPDRAIERRLELSVDGDGELLDSASPALAGARQEIRTSRNRLIQKLESMLRGLEGGAEGSVTVRNGRYVIPVPRDSRSRPAGIVHDESASGATLFLEPSAVLELGNALREAEVRAEREELAVCRELTDLLRPERLVLAEALEMCVAVDDLVARAATRPRRTRPARIWFPQGARSSSGADAIRCSWRCCRPGAWCRSISSSPAISAPCSSAAPTPAARPCCSRRSD